MSNDLPAPDPDVSLPEELPVLPLREFVAFPYMVLPLFVARARSVAAIDDAVAGNRMLLLVAQRDPSQSEPEPEDLYGVGVVGMVLRSMHLSDGRVKVLVQGLRKARIDSFIEREGCTWVRTTALRNDDQDESWCVEGEAIVRSVRGRV